MPAAMMMPSPKSNPSNGARLVATDGRALPLTGTTLRADAQGGIARVTLEQRFTNPYAEPLRLTYLVPLPEDGAVSAYSFRFGQRTIVGKVEPRGLARERFERALTEGRTAAILDEERGSLFTQELGNVPPHAEIVCTLTIDQRLLWIDEGAWEWRFPTVVAPRYLGEPGRTPDAARVTVDVANAALPAAMTLALSVRDALSDKGAPSSPSHLIAVRDDAEGKAISLVAERGAALDRDVVVRWPVVHDKVGLAVAVSRPGATHALAAQSFGLVTIVPPAQQRIARAVGRDLCLLLDTSGSMDGAPLDQARSVAAALVETLGDADQLEMIEFGNDARRWKRSSVPASAKHRAEAQKWLSSLRASGGTDMTAGIYEAIATLRAEAQRQVVLITDGQIGFEQEVLAQICARLPKQSRLHTVGVGSAVNRSLTGPAARAGGGIEVVIGVDEDPTQATARIVRRTARPLVVEVELSGSALAEAATRSSADLYAGAPALLSLRLRPEGGELVVRGRSAEGPYEERVLVAPIAAGQGNPAHAALYARERVAELELRAVAGAERAPIDGEIEQLGVGFQIATRLTSFVAVSDTVDVDPTAATRNEAMPHMLPHGMSAGGLGLRAASPVMQAVPMSPAPMMMRTRAGVMPFGGAMASKGAARGAIGAAYDSGADDEAPAESLDDNFDAESLASASVPTSSSAQAGPPAQAPKSESAKDAASPRRQAPPKTPSPPAEKAPSLLERARRFISRVGSAARTLRGRLRSISATTRVIELEVDAPLSWTLPTRIVLRGADGSEREVAFVLDGTTRAGEYDAGQTVRVLVQFAGEAPTSAELTLANGLALDIDLSPEMP